MTDALALDRLAQLADVVEHGFAPNGTSSNQVAKEMRVIVRRMRARRMIGDAPESVVVAGQMGLGL